MFRRLGVASVLIGALVAAALGAFTAAFAQGGASPSGGTVGPANGSSAKWTFDPVVGVGEGGTPIEAVCAPGQCSTYSLTIRLPAPPTVFYASYQVTLKFHCAWNSPAPTDVDCFAFGPAGDEAAGPGKPDTSNAGPNFEDISIIDPPPGTWSLRADAGIVPVPTSATGFATLSYKKLLPSPPPIGLRPSDAQFANFDLPVTYQSRDAANRPNAGEPSLGVDQATGKVMYMAGNQVTRLTYDKATPPKPTPTDVTPANSKVNEDAILFTDATTHRTWALGLLLAGSYEAYSDNDGATWTPGAAASVPALPDHETLGAGPYHAPAPAHTYPHAVYYCAQTIVQDAYCGRSDDGGVTFAPLAAPLWNGVCSPIHGHVRVGPTGIVYVPNSSCTGASGKPRSGVAVSTDNGQSFSVSMPPDSSPGTVDPSVAEGPDGIVYFGYQAANGHPMIAMATHDAAGKLHWSPSIGIGRFSDPGETEDGLPQGVQNIEFPEVITGDAGRAAFAFLGTGQPGSFQDGAFTGTWYLFVSYTFDGGKHWRTVNATPHDPVQRGCVWNGGLVNACRNLLDFNDIGVDHQGHVYVAYTDGCTANPTYNCDTTPGIHGWNNLSSKDTRGCSLAESGVALSTRTCTFGRLSAIVRQVCGRGLIAAYDPGFVEDPRCPASRSASNTAGSRSSAVGSAVPSPPAPLPSSPGPVVPAASRSLPAEAMATKPTSVRPVAPAAVVVATITVGLLYARRRRRPHR
jgi:hypothetical protein